MKADHPQVTPVVLIVDDDDALRETLQMLLEDEGYRVLQASDSIEALAMALVQRIDAILLDLSIPHLTGEAFCRAYRERGGTAGVILMTARMQDRVTAPGSACNGSSYLAKPFAAVDVLAALVEQLGRSSVSS
jgi:DNA-binding response OmpR family regulator